MTIKKVKVAKGTTIKEIPERQLKDYIANGWRLIQDINQEVITNPFKK